MRHRTLWIWLAGTMLAAPMLHGQSNLCDEPAPIEEVQMACPQLNPELPPPPAKPDPFQLRLLRYADETARHKVAGLASYYSRSLEGTLTANGERYRAQRFTAAHLTLPLGCWIEITSRATGKKIRARVNDRGPYVYKFVLDLSYSAAHALGVDVAEDRHVDFRIIGLKGEEPLPENLVVPPATPLTTVETAAK